MDIASILLNGMQDQHSEILFQIYSPWTSGTISGLTIVRNNKYSNRDYSVPYFCQKSFIDFVYR